MPDGSMNNNSNEIRHEHTNYDKMLMKHGGRAHARETVRSGIEKVLASWERNADKT